jgi:endonuclease YncB( thermonuclease family)
MARSFLPVLPFFVTILWAASLLAQSSSAFAYRKSTRNHGLHRASSPAPITTTTTTTTTPAALNVRGGGRLETKLEAAKKAVASATPWLKTSIAMSIAALKDLSKTQRMLFLLTLVLGFVLGKIQPFWKSFKDVTEIPGRYFGPTAPVLTGRAVSVSDGDTIRFYHTPLHLFGQKSPKGKYRKSEVAIPVRLCSMDAPETAKFGSKGQPFGFEAKNTLTKLLENKLVHIRLLSKDQYGRAVAQVFVKKTIFFRTYADEHMLQTGMAEVYEGGGAVYGPKGKNAYVKMQEDARTKKLGIWSQNKRESAAEYKKRAKK